MGLFDSMKSKLGPAKEKVSDLAQQHGGKIQHGIDKAAKVVDEKTKGKYSEKIHAGTDKAKDAMDRLAHQDGTEPPRSEGPGPVPKDGPGSSRSRDAGTPPVPPETPPPAS